MAGRVLRRAALVLLCWGLGLAPALALNAAPLDAELIRAAGLKPYPVPLKGPGFRLPDRKERLRSKTDYAGRVVLLNFWASWCPPCRKEFPSLERLQRRFSDAPFSVLAVTVADSPADVEGFLAGREPPFDVLIDTSEGTAKAYRAAGVPVTYLLDRQGRLLAGKAGELDWDSPAVVRLIQAAIEDR
ncbi:TlpA family protein disulfide reductase [Magnetovirga frankeli]|uniref:TlpA family protein disulfide reductase n=1 Tax=Magnetovirga frankeli TaxID=947516 RepID=UPI001292F91B|nr:TlpA family protein disulfide reductase [gamma proteobacterium SS-5]